MQYRMCSTEAGKSNTRHRSQTLDFSFTLYEQVRVGIATFKSWYHQVPSGGDYNDAMKIPKSRMINQPATSGMGIRVHISSHPAYCLAGTWYASIPNCSRRLPTLLYQLSGITRGRLPVLSRVVCCAAKHE